MANCEPYIATHYTPGRTQTDRPPSNLGNDFVQIDERRIEDLIVSTCKLSSYVHYYGGENVVMGNWESFFGWEPTSILAQIASLDIQKLQSDYRKIRRKLILVPTEDTRKEVEAYFDQINLLLQDIFQKVTQIPADQEINEYFRTTSVTLKGLFQSIRAHIDLPDDLSITFSNHLFNRKLQNLYGLLGDWKRRSHEQLHKNLSSYPKHSPHYALFITFLQLFESAQKDLNTFTKRHLDFYYKDVLHLKPQKARPDYVHCCIQPYENAAPFSLEKDRVFLAGKDTDGNKKYYASTADATINQAQIEALYSGFKKENTYYFNQLTEKNAAGSSWPMFTTDAVMDKIGLVIASPLLFLKGGERTININFIRSNGTDLTLDLDNYHFYLSGEEEWFQVQNPVNDASTLKLALGAEDPAIIPFDTEIHEGVVIDCPYPMLKIVAKNGVLSSFSFSQYNLGVVVSNYKAFKLFSDIGNIDHTKAFHPFGLMPKNGLALTFSSQEFFQKKNARGTFVIKTEPKTDNTEWNIFEHTKPSLLVNGLWDEDTDWDIENDYQFQNKGPAPINFGEDKTLNFLETNGFLKIELNNGYPGETYLNNFITQSKLEAPDLPYVPLINEIYFKYTANSEDNEVQVYNIFPKGYKASVGNKIELLPNIDNEGELFIGIKNIEKGNSLSLLFQVVEGSANPRQLPAKLNWSHLKGNRWEGFKPESLGDETSGLTQSGIVQLQAPEDLDTNNQSILPPGIWWVRVEVPARVDALCHMIGIHTQALKARLYDYENKGVGFKEPLEARVISKLLRPKNQIKKIEQPYASFGGRLKDTDELFYQRASERLRHKEKAISTWDYETLVLDNFPQVYRVKCLNHFRYDAEKLNNASAGYVTIIPVAKSTAKETHVYWKPLVDIGIMKRIKSFLELHASPHARINVKPPRLEKLELVFNVKYRAIEGADSRLYTQQLTESINAYLSPWAYAQDSSLEFQSEIEKSRLIQLIEMQTFVDYISEFKVNHHILAATSDEIIQSFNDVEQIIPKSVFSLFVPFEHSITTITNSCCT